MRILAIDFGEKRMGFATGNTTTRTANPINPLLRKNLQHDMNFIMELIDQYDIDHILLGYPLNMDGSKGKMTQKVEQFKNQLSRKIKIEIEYVDERLSSFEAEEILKSQVSDFRKRKQLIDSVSALILINNYLEDR